MAILIIDPDEDVAAPLVGQLRRGGHRVLTAGTGGGALALLAAAMPALVVLEPDLPDLDGFELCRRLRRDDRVPVVLATARRGEADVMRGYELGADDYVTKPYSPRILAARVAGILRGAAEAGRRPEPEREHRVRLDGLEVDVGSYRVHLEGEPVALMPLRTRILFLLAANGGRAVPYRRLIRDAWNDDGGSRGRLKVHIHYIRRALDAVAPGAATIRVITGVGYRLDVHPSHRAAACSVD
jgi:DNA-binding response OmpR family regulator